MKHKLFYIAIIVLICLQTFSQPKGNLFIIGGGDRSPQLIETLITTAKLNTTDYIVVLPMATEYPDTAYYYIKTDLEKACSNTIANLNFTKDKVHNAKWLDSLQHAKLIFLTGGDQNRFMNIALHTPVQQAILTAYANGATVAGTSAGAAMMTRYMITGNEKGNVELLQGSLSTENFHCAP